MLFHYLHYVYIDVTGVIAIVMDIWGDRHASACNPSFVSIVLCALELRFCSLATAADSVCVLVTSGPTVLRAPYWCSLATCPLAVLV